MHWKRGGTGKEGLSGGVIGPNCCAGFEYQMMDHDLNKKNVFGYFYGVLATILPMSMPCQTSL